jgi:hypothetical protein
VILFENKVFGDVVKMRSLGWALIQYDRCPNINNICIETDIHRRNTMQRQGEYKAMQR